MMSKIIVVFSLFGLFSACVGQIVQVGQCPNVQLVSNFSAQNFLGTWYEISRSVDPNQNGECADLQFTRTGTTTNVKHSTVVENFLEEASGTATLVDGNPRVTLNIPSYGSAIQLSVLLTDYQTYALTYSCENISTTQRRIHIWVLGRERGFPNEMIPALINTTISTTFGISAQELRPVQHGPNECLILPVIQAGQPIILPGQCDPNIPVVQSFNVARFTGTWHQISSYQNSNSGGTCTRADYTLAGNAVNVLNSQVSNRTLVTLSGQATVSSTDGSARLSVVLNIGGAPRTQNLWILATDYNNYAISYDCENMSNNQKRVYSFITSRTRQLPANIRAQVDQVVNSITDLNYRYFVDTNQSDDACFFYPNPVPNTPVVFRGQCSSTNVQAMRNFDATRYMGKWHTIELYPASFQDGDCSNANYALNSDGTIAVLNTHVVNETLRSVNAVGVTASTDGSAKLIVNFPIPGSNQTLATDYWVLATDYTNYALVYSCTNLNADEMRVSAWKLSRTKQLTPNSQTAIANVLNSALVLDQRYFEVMDQSTQACFYYPEPQPGVPVVFPGQCATTIPVVQNFNFAQFQGAWREVEAYPNSAQPGQCANHVFSFVSNSQLTFVSNAVDDQFQSTIVGTISSSPNDNSGRLVMTVTNPNGSVRTVPFWVLATDYNNYALVYSCSNVGNDFQEVLSMKLSRTTQLPAAANTAINTAISNINVPVLGNQYFQNVDQSDRACFTLPVIQAGQPIIIPGQCSTNVPAVPNFNLRAYTGRWRLVESYASNFQTGTCNVAEYTFVNANTINVTNSQVVNQALGTSSGNATISSTDGSGKLTFTLPSGATFEYYVLATDYNSYALAYGCVNVNANERRIYSWKLSRQNTLTPAAVNNINAVINTVDVLNNRYYYTVDRSDTGCFYFPTPDSTRPVQFRGRCQNIPVVTNFNAANYLGVWRDIESYPSNFQSGTCNTAFYSPGNDVDVTNSQVINQALFTISGSASLQPSTDGSAKLEVTFNVGGANVTTSYWVVATDYVSYSLVYSCETIDDEFIRVAAWKLSRTRSLTPAAATAINSAMSNINVLDQRYFVTRDHSANGCFYYPEPNTGVVVFPGQCDNTIAAVPNFNMASFGGVWYETEAYPKDFNPGQCVDHEFTQNTTNVLNVVSSAINNQNLNQLRGSLRFSSTTDTSGKLMLTINTASGGVDERPFWVLSTDYTNYALAYSCINMDADYRMVYSWKLSRTRQMSAASNTAINNAIAPINVLDNRYYLDTIHTDSACFYLPDYRPGEVITLPGRCDTNIRGMPNFNLARYAGRWRLIESYGSRFQTGTCNIADYELQTSNSLSVTHAQVVNQALGSISGSANTTDNTGKLLITLEGRVQVYEYYVLDTDYDSYALGYGCVNLNNNRRQVSSWKMSRTNTLTAAANANMNRIIASIDVLHQPYYYTVDRSDAACFYFPPPDPGTPVRFRGQCDENIPVVTNFNAARYLGLWHDIQSYPLPFQNGSCPNAYYGLNSDGSVSVYNTHVVGNTLNDINGFAVVVSTDGSAKLNVTFNIRGENVTTSYWVLATDYDNYAFVYSCTNLNDEYRSVTSWKLSRTKTLSAASNTAINAVMNNHNVLDQRYYINRDHSPAGCFYYPDPRPGEPVVFPGQCSQTIAAVSAFSMNAFQGVWHEIAAYPTQERPRQCASQQYALSSTSNALVLTSRSVSNQTLTTIPGQLTFSSATDGSGKLTATLNINGQNTQIPYWILSTDYSNYALAYSCVNLNSDYRRVLSWKLSRTQQLTNAANTAINTAIANIDVLENVYYENIPQTADSCFYLPDLGPTEPVIFPGQCDPNIPVIRNFNTTRYLGRWRLIESYYTAFQTGSCNTAEYSAASDGSVTVLNTRIVNQELNTITGRAVPSTNDGSGKLSVTFPSNPDPMDYWILDTDYDSYALVYTCQNLNNNEKRVWSWKLSRTNNLTPAATTAINRIVNSIDVLNDRYYTPVDRTDAGCFYFPPPDAGTNVVFPGQCEQSIPVVPNFDAARYVGTWYDIQSYPTNFQSGTCNTAQYTLAPGGVVNVQNTQVVNQVLQTMTGTAVTATTDGSAKLKVTFNLSSGPVTTDYWVLATDYTTYSLVYSCRNIDSESRAVYSWKLGRQTSLPAAANTAINNVINNVQVLSQQYYVQRDHTPSGCFYYPDNNGGDVIMLGQCLADNQVPAINNFASNSWSGIWYEIARFPSDVQNGECSNNRFTVTGSNAFSVIRTFVVNETQETSTTLATVPASGRGVFSANINGVPFSNVYVLATDYTEYALLYACRNLDATRKQVYSWKLSRSQAGLSTAANNMIDQLVSNNIDLHEPYYRYTGQDAAACFHYPDFDQLPAVIELIGQCDTSIRGVPNFNAGAYFGRWFEMARYPQTAQTGQCNRAEYSSAGNAVSVVNSQVVNSTLASISGTAVVVGTDGVLRVTFNIGGVSRNVDLYVLATDYVSYSLAYSCINLPNGNRQVGSWKLSRTTTLSTQALTVMDTVIANTQGLRQQYYQDTDQSDESCFYVPAVNPQQAPLFRGQCEQITGMAGFNPTRYLGWWHEIERYPVDGVAGNCISSNYEAQGNTIQVVDTSVTGSSATIVTGTATVTNDGRIRRVLSDGRVQDLWVLATDYDNYALLYSCENVNSEYRRVWSAKHSKARSLTPAAEQAMAPVINNNRVLYPQFYQAVDQSDRACFHYPTQTGPQVVIPGQCDQSIIVTQNFDLEKFEGNWYQIQRYDEVGNRTCASTSIVHNATSNHIDIIAYEAVDGNLTAAEGSGRFISTDGSARLSIVLAVPGTNDTITRTIYILATDYEDYALAYSCVNVGAFHRQVGAWQLSRERTMSASGAISINSVIANREELHLPYFKPISQTDCPEPSSAFFTQSSIILMAICAMLQLLL